MSSSNKTRYLNLNQYLGTDKLKRTDYNGDMLNIDNGVKVLIKNLSMSQGVITATKLDGTTVKLGTSDNIVTVTKFNELINAKRARLDDIWVGV